MLTYIRFIESGSGTILDSIDLLIWRIFYLNYSNNIQFASYFLSENYFFGWTYIQDLLSVISNEQGFNAWFTSLRKSPNIELFTTTPTFIAEGIVNFGRYLPIFLPLIIFFTLTLMAQFSIIIFKNYGELPIIIFLFFTIKFFQVMIPQGYGTFLFNYLPKILISIIIPFIILFLKNNNSLKKHDSL